LAEYINENLNPVRRRAGDCTVRAISKFLGEEWETIYVALALEGFRLCDMPSANHVWAAYLRRKGYKRHSLPNTCPDCYTVAQFCDDHPKGTYMLALSGHVVTVINGCYYDSWDSGDETPIYYFSKGDLV
jgi:hypothetical protein